MKPPPARALLRLATLLAALALSAALPRAMAAEIMAPERYVERLQAIDASLANGDLAQAGALSAACAECEVSWPGGRLRADPTIGVLIAAAASARARLRIAAVLAQCSPPALRGPPAAAGGEAAAARLAAIARQEAEAQRQLRHGGTISGLPEADMHLPGSWREASFAVLSWLGLVADKAWEWVSGWLPEHEANAASHAGSDPLVLLISCLLVGMILVVGVVMAWRGWRTRAAEVPRLGSAPAAAGVDADPRSRAVDEWLAYAQQLFAAGRYREATRAWFHALLVQCWSHGLIHQRIGKTNWEYALLLPVALPWRGQFQDLTRQYDRIWYGGRDEREAVAQFAGDTRAILDALRPTPAHRP